MFWIARLVNPSARPLIGLFGGAKGMPTVEDLKGIYAGRGLHIDIFDESARDFFHQAGEKQRLFFREGDGFGKPIGGTSVNHVTAQGPGGTAKAKHTFVVSQFTP